MWLLRPPQAIEDLSDFSHCPAPKRSRASFLLAIADPEVVKPLADFDEKYPPQESKFTLDGRWAPVNETNN